MTKFKLISSETEDTEPVGIILVGEYTEDKQSFILTKDSEYFAFGRPRWYAGEPMPVEGGLWVWEEVKEYNFHDVTLSINGVTIASFADDVCIKRKFICDYRQMYSNGVWWIDFYTTTNICIYGSCTKPTKRQIRKWRRECRKSQH